MAARRSWCVLVDDGDRLYGCDHYSGRYFPHNDNMILSVFFREAHAEAFARQIAQKYPGKDVHVFSQQYGFTAQPRPVEAKTWTPDGQFIPTK